jgi:hypothetical protein
VYKLNRGAYWSRIEDVPFDLVSFKDRSARLTWDDLDLAAFRAHALGPAALRCLRYMHDVEYHTVCYLRDLLLTPAHADPDVTAFLSLWVYEEFWHGEALAAILAAHGEAHGNTRVLATRRRQGAKDRVRPLVMTLGGWVGRSDFTALLMTWGAINEWTTQAGYSLLARKAGHPVLAELLGRIMRQEGRHIDFYATQARARLARSPRARHLTRTSLSYFWRPVGSGVMPAEETQFLKRYLMGDDNGLRAVRRVDANVARLPGLAGLRLLEQAVRSQVPDEELQHVALGHGPGEVEALNQVVSGISH